MSHIPASGKPNSACCVWICLAWVFPVDRRTQHMAACVWRLSLSVFPRFSYVVACVSLHSPKTGSDWLVVGTSVRGLELSWTQVRRRWDGRGVDVWKASWKNWHLMMGLCDCLPGSHGALE